MCSRPNDLALNLSTTVNGFGTLAPGEVDAGGCGRSTEVPEQPPNKQQAATSVMATRAGRRPTFRIVPLHDRAV
jgi:hypothetical protein